MNSKAFKTQKDTWYKKLKESGFSDIEYDDGSIKSCTPRSIRGRDESLRQATQDYYYMCYHFLNEHTFNNELEKVIWEYHSNGISIRNILKTLNKAGITKFNPENKPAMNKNTIWKLINDLEKIMKFMYLSI